MSPAWVMLTCYLVMSVATFCAYRADKVAAQRGRRRTEESALHLMALTGGWPGALLAMRRYRHKTRKQPFRLVFWVTVTINIVVSVWLFTTLAATA